MDPSIYMQFSPQQSGLPQESKMAAYMNRTAVPTRSLNQSLAKMTMESPTPDKNILINEFLPVNYFAPGNILPDSPKSSPPNNIQMNPPGSQVHQENVGGTTYYYTNSDGLVTSAPINLNTNVGLAASVYMPETIRSEIYQRNEDAFLQPDLRHYPDLPENVEMFSELLPLESAVAHSVATAFRATHRQSAEHSALRRLHGFSGSISKRLEVWKKIDHPNIVKLNDFFTTKAFNDHSLIMAYNYHPSAITLMSKYLSTGTGPNATESTGPKFHDPFSSDPDAPRPYTHQKNAMLRAVACGALLPEAVLWSLLVQLTAALRAIHTAGLACRSLDATKVIMNGCRVRIAWCGTSDVLLSNTNDINQAQQEDLNALGRLALALACRTIHCENLSASLELVARTYSPDLKNLILYLLSNSAARRSVNDLMPMIGARFYTQVEALEKRADVFEDQLAREIDNGRLLRILVKLGVVNERPELNMDSSWSETGDRYMLKLFRDYLFHGVTAEGRPWLDQAHLAHCLNQLDAGTNQKVELMSRDEQSVLVVSYAELKHCLDQAFDEVMQAAAAPTS